MKPCEAQIRPKAWEHREKGRQHWYSDRSLPFLSNGSEEKSRMALRTGKNIQFQKWQTFLADLFAADCGASFYAQRRTIQGL